MPSVLLITHAPTPPFWPR